MIEDIVKKHFNRKIYRKNDSLNALYNLYLGNGYKILVRNKEQIYGDFELYYPHDLSIPNYLIVIMNDRYWIFDEIKEKINLNDFKYFILPK